MISANLSDKSSTDTKSNAESASKSLQENIININKNSNSFIGKISDSFVNLKNSLKFNVISSNKRAKLHKEPCVYISGNNYDMTKYPKEKIFAYLIENYIYLTYRNDFDPIESNNIFYTNDCGWGCMIRSAQMILSKCILEYKKNLVVLSNSDFSIIKQLLIEVIMLTSDNLLNSKDLIENKDFKYLNQLSNKPNIYSPFSIQIITKLEESNGRYAGVEFSDITCMNIIEKLNDLFNPLSNFIIFTSKSIIYEIDLINKFFIKVSNIENVDKEKLHLYNNEYYIMNDNLFGCLFISLRLGIEKISPEYYSCITNLYQIKGNIGMIGGLNNRAFYYYCANNKNELFYLDPHLNQKSYKNHKDLVENYIETYIPYNTYKCNISEVSPAMTFGFIFKSFNEFKNLINNLKNQSKIKNPIITFSNTKSENDEEIKSKTVQILNIEDDFNLVDFEN